MFLKRRNYIFVYIGILLDISLAKASNNLDEGYENLNLHKRHFVSYNAQENSEKKARHNHENASNVIPLPIIFSTAPKEVRQSFFEEKKIIPPTPLNFSHALPSINDILKKPDVQQNTEGGTRYNRIDITSLTFSHTDIHLTIDRGQIYNLYSEKKYKEVYNLLCEISQNLQYHLQDRYEADLGRAKLHVQNRIKMITDNEVYTLLDKVSNDSESLCLDRIEADLLKVEMFMQNRTKYFNKKKAINLLIDILNNKEIDENLELKAKDFMLSLKGSVAYRMKN